MRCLVRIADKWQQEQPSDLNRWLMQHDGQEAICIEGNTYYCATEDLKRQYEEKWAKERKIGDKRRAAMFIALSDQLVDRTAQPQDNAIWCEGEGCYCTEIASCNGSCL